jgi:hypothetical protein
MRVAEFVCLLVLVAGSSWLAGAAQAPPASAYLIVQTVTADPASSSLRVVFKNVGSQKVTGFGVLVSSQQFTQEFFYAIGMEQKLTPRSPGFGGIQPGESIELLFPVAEGAAPNAEVNAVILEDRTAAGDEAQVASMFSYRQSYALEWERWALVIGQAVPAIRAAEQAEILRSLGEVSTWPGDAATVAGRMGARKAISSLLTQAAPQNGAALAAYVQERAAVLGWHAQRQGATANPLASVSARASACTAPVTSDIKTAQLSLVYPGQPQGIRAYVDISCGEGGAAPRSSAKGTTLSVIAVGASGGAESAPACNPQFIASASNSASAATITGEGNAYVPGLGCAITGSQSAMALAMAPEPEYKLASLQTLTTDCGCPYTGVTPYSPDPYPLDIDNLTAATKEAITCIQRAAAAAPWNGSFTVTFGYRPAAYQTHLYEVYTKYQQIGEMNTPECAAVKANVQAEWNMHAPFAHAPGETSRHSSGTAFDAAWSPGNLPIDNLAQQCSLSRCVPGDAVHFCR